jgi:hypothetical protein
MKRMSGIYKGLSEVDTKGFGPHGNAINQKCQERQQKATATDKLLST